MPSEIVIKNKEIASFYYQAQLYFKSIGLLCETVANYLKDNGFIIKSGTAASPISYENYSYNANNGACLPKYFKIMFMEKNEELAQTVNYAFFIWFFAENPESDAAWVPCGFISKAQSKIPGDWKIWSCQQRIADQVRLHLLSPQREDAFLSYTYPWPEKLKGNGIDELASLEIVSFSLSAIVNSDDIAALLGRVVPLLKEGKANELKADDDYLRRFLGVEL